MKLLKVVICVIIVIGLSACGREDANDTLEHPSMNVDIIMNSDGSSSSIKNGSQQYFFTVEDGETVGVEMIFDNHEGEIGVNIAIDGEEENAGFNEQNLTSGIYYFIISEAGTYQILYTCKDYIGEYSYSLHKE